MRIIDFLGKLYSSEDLRGLYEKGLIEAEDIHQRDKKMTRGDAARFAHLYLRGIKKIPDLTDISKAEVVRDLYDCRVCANYIAQVFLRGVMSAKEIPGIVGDGEARFLFFDTKSGIDISEAGEIVEKLTGYKVVEIKK